MMLGETVNEEYVLGDDAYDRQVLLDAELWRAISAQEETTNQLCSSIYSAHLKVFRDTHGMLDEKLDPLERKELQLRELAVLDEFQRRIHQAAKAMQEERRELEETVNASRNCFAEDLKVNLQREQASNVEEKDNCGPGPSKPHSARDRARSIHRAVKFLHRAIVVGGIAGFLSAELFKAAKKSGFNLQAVSKGMQTRRTRKNKHDAIHTLPQISIPNCGTRDTVMSD